MTQEAKVRKRAAYWLGYCPVAWVSLWKAIINGRYLPGMSSAQYERDQAALDELDAMSRVLEPGFYE